MIFKNRSDAGKQLAQKLLAFRDEKPLFLALPRGGVPVAYEIVKILKAPLDTIVVRKIGPPFNPEFGVGAIGPFGVIIFDNQSLKALGLRKDDLGPVIQEENKEMERRVSLFKSGEYSKNLKPDIIIIVDDGLATGVSAQAAIEAVKIDFKPKKIILAAPVCASDTAQKLKNYVDEVVCVAIVDDLMAVGNWYEDFNQTSDKEVIDFVEKANSKVL